MESLAQQFLDHLEWLVSRRWFGDKARPVTDLSVDIADFVMCGKVPVILAIVRCEFEWGPASAYFVPILATPGPLPERDATANPAFLEWLVSGFAHEREVGGRWRWRRIGDDFPETEGLDYSRAKAIASEQSNTSIVFDSAFIGKVFRKVQPGLNPDLEIAEHIMRGGTFHHVPELYGVIELWQDGARTDILAVQQFVANIGDGWSWMLHELAQPERRDGARCGASWHTHGGNAPGLERRSR